MRKRTLGQGLEVSAEGLGCMGMSEFYGTADEDEATATIHRALELGVDAPRHGRHVRAVHERAAGRPGDRRTAATRSCSRRSSATCAARTASGSASAATPSTCAQACDASLRAARRRPHRPLLPAPRRPERADRGDGRRDGGAGRGRQGAPPRPVGGVARDDPPRARRAPDHRAADRVLAVDARPRGRDPADRARARDRLRRVQPARPRLPVRPLHRRRTTSPRTTSARATRASRARTSQRNLELVERVKEIADEKGVDARPAGAGVGARAAGDDIVPIPGTTRRRATWRRTSRRSSVELTDDDLAADRRGGAARRRRRRPLRRHVVDRRLSRAPTSLARWQATCRNH